MFLFHVSRSLWRRNKDERLFQKNGLLNSPATSNSESGTGTQEPADYTIVKNALGITSALCRLPVSVRT
jgi:hypothetical protein